MNQEKELTQIGNSAGEYLAPGIRVVEIKVRKVICGSYGSAPASMGWNADDGENWN